MKKYGFLGLGIMGQAMAANLLKADFTVTVWNRTASKCESLINKGASHRETPARKLHFRKPCSHRRGPQSPAAIDRGSGGGPRRARRPVRGAARRRPVARARAYTTHRGRRR